MQSAATQEAAKLLTTIAIAAKGSMLFEKARGMCCENDRLALVGSFAASSAIHYDILDDTHHIIILGASRVFPYLPISVMFGSQIIGWTFS